MHRTFSTLATLLLLGWVATASAAAPDAANQEGSQKPVAGARLVGGVTPDQLGVIRIISRNVLAAKHSGVEDGADAAQLANLRAMVDRLVLAELEAAKQGTQDATGKEATPRTTPEGAEGLTAAARADASGVATQLRLRSEHLQARSRSGPEAAVLSAGHAVGEQRARLFDRWAEKLDVALGQEGNERTARLLALRDQLRPASQAVLREGPVEQFQPTLQVRAAQRRTPNKNDATSGVVR